MEAQLSEANTFPSQSYSQSFFTRLPTDNRFLQVSYYKYPPMSTIDNNTKTIRFVCEKLEAANVYMIQETVLELRIKIVKADGTLPLATAKVAPRNNVLHTMWESCRLYINDQLLTMNASDYHYKSYISSLLSFPMTSKGTHMQTQGWFSDQCGEFNETDEEKNYGFGERSRLFRQENKKDGAFRPEGAEFFGRIAHDLISCESGLPPNTKFKIELDRAPDAFVLQTASSDAEKYKVLLENVSLYVPVAQLSFSVFNELSSLIGKVTDGAFFNNVSIHYRRLHIQPVAIPSGNQAYYTKGLLSNTDSPCKIVVCFVESAAKAGSYHQNPYEFRRSWEVKTSDAEHYKSDFESFEADKINQQLSLLHNQISKQQEWFEKMILQQQQQQNQFMDSFSKIVTTPTPQPETANSRTTRSTVAAAVQQSADERLENFIANSAMELPVSISPEPPRGPGSSTTSQFFSTHPNEDDPPDPPNPPVPPIPPPPKPPLKATKIQFIKSVQCTLNSAPLDMVRSNYKN